MHEKISFSRFSIIIPVQRDRDDRAKALVRRERYRTARALGALANAAKTVALTYLPAAAAVVEHIHIHRAFGKTQYNIELIRVRIAQTVGYSLFLLQKAIIFYCARIILMLI